MGHIHDRPAADAGTGTTARLLDLAADLDWEILPEGVRRAAARHLIDTLGAMVGGAGGELSDRVERTLAALRPEGTVTVPGRTRRLDLLDAAYLGGISAHGIEVDDGYREGAVHPGAVIVPALLPLAVARKASGRELLVAMIAGYEVMLRVAKACHPALRRRGFHPTAIVGPLGAAAAAGCFLGLSRERISNALGIAASSSAGLHAYVNGGADVKRLHAGHAAREGLQAALLAKQDVAGPPGVLEGQDGFFQAFTSAAEAPAIAAAATALATSDHFLIGDCYIKPFTCCRHLHPAAEALIRLVAENGIDATSIDGITVETYGLAAEHAAVPWSDFASAQLSFPYVMATAASFGDVTLRHFAPENLANPKIARLCGTVRVLVAEDMDQAYPRLRPSRVTVTAAGRTFRLQVDEATGAPEMPLSDERLGRKFLDLAAPTLGAERPAAVLGELWRIAERDDVSTLIAGLTPAEN